MVLVTAYHLVLLGSVQGRAVDPLNRELSFAVERRVQQGLDHGEIGVVQLRVLPHQPDNRFVRHCLFVRSPVQLVLSPHGTRKQC